MSLWTTNSITPSTAGMWAMPCSRPAWTINATHTVWARTWERWRTWIQCAASLTKCRRCGCWRSEGERFLGADGRRGVDDRRCASLHRFRGEAGPDQPERSGHAVQRLGYGEGDRRGRKSPPTVIQRLLKDSLPSGARPESSHSSDGRATIDVCRVVNRFEDARTPTETTPCPKKHLAPAAEKRLETHPQSVKYPPIKHRSGERVLRK